MKRISLIVVASLVLALLVYAHGRAPHAKSETPAPQPPTIAPQDRTVATQDRINRYFHRDVIPRLRDCWKEVQGAGEIEMKFTYRRAGSGWTWERLERSSSTLPGGQDAVALLCMQEAVRGTSFPVGEGDSAGGSGAVVADANKHVLHWNWPVPLPTTSVEFAEFRKKAGVGKTGGCDGHGAAARCVTYKQSPGQCECASAKVCVGYDRCNVQAGACSLVGECSSGGPFGVSGGTIIY